MAENITSTIQGPLTVGNVTEKRGELVRGALPLISLPTGNDITIPVVIASGVHDGTSYKINLISHSYSSTFRTLHDFTSHPVLDLLTA